MSDAADVLLFSYGTLRQPEVQLATFGRLLEGREATVVGFRLEWLTITDPAVIATSGSDRHPLLVPIATAAAPDAADGTVPGAQPGTAAGTAAGIAAGTVSGTVFRITPAELDAADAYEVDDYVRVRVPLDTGEEAWVYVFAGDGTPAA